eukprot:1325489-Prymnesium_polylepis.2
MSRVALSRADAHRHRLLPLPHADAAACPPQCCAPAPAPAVPLGQRLPRGLDLLDRQTLDGEANCEKALRIDAEAQLSRLMISRLGHKEIRVSCRYRVPFE